MHEQPYVKALSRLLLLGTCVTLAACTSDRAGPKSPVAPTLSSVSGTWQVEQPSPWSDFRFTLSQTGCARVLVNGPCDSAFAGNATSTPPVCQVQGMAATRPSGTPYICGAVFPVTGKVAADDVTLTFPVPAVIADYTSIDFGGRLANGSIIGTLTFTDPAGVVHTIGGGCGSNPVCLDAPGGQLTFIRGGTPPPVVYVFPSTLRFTTQPTSAVAGAVFPQTLSVAVQDSAGRTDTTASDTITVAIGTNPASGTLSGITTVVAVKGVATFSTLSIDALGTGYTLIASASGLTAATSAPIAVTQGSVASLAFIVQPSVGVVGLPLSPAVQVAIRDAAGNVMTAATNPVILAIGANLSNAALSGTTTVAAVNGIATFSTLRLSNVGTGYTVNAYAAGLRGATSATFSIKHDFLLTCGASPVFGSPLKLQGGTRVALAGKPHAVGVSSGVAYVSQLDDHTIAPASLSTFAFGSGISVGNSPLHVAFNSSRTTAYVTTFAPSVAVVDVASGTVASHFSVTGRAYGIQVAPGDSLVWVATSADSVFGIRTASGAIGHRINIGAVRTGLELPTDLAVCDSLVFVLSDGGLLAEFATPRHSLRSAVFVGGTPQSMVIPSDNSHIYVANQDGTLDIVDFPDSVVSRTRLSGGGFGLAQSPADGRLYVTTLDGQVQVIDPQTNAKVDSFFVGGTVSEIAFNPSGTITVEANESGWVDFLTAPGVVTPPAPPHVLLGGEPLGAAISPAGVVYVTLLDNRRVVEATLPSFAFSSAVRVGGTIGRTPTDVAFNSTGTRAYVTNQFANTGGSAGSVSVIDVAAGQEVATIPLNDWYAYSLIVAPGDSILWVTSDKLYGIQTNTGTIV